MEGTPVRFYCNSDSLHASCSVTGSIDCAECCTWQEGGDMMGFSARASMRRSTRIQVRIPVSVTGILPSGEPFTEQTYVLTVSKFGAWLRCRYPLSPGMEVRVRPKVGNADGLFHVVWVGGGAGNPDEVGIQYVKPSNLFGVVFPG